MPPLLPINWMNILKPSLAGFVAEYQAVYDSFTTKPSSSVAAEQNAMVESWIDDGLWAKRDAIYLHAVHTNGDGEALKNWKNPGTNDATIVNAPAFVAFEGFTGDGATSYINYNWNPSDGTLFVQDSLCIAKYIRNNIQHTTYMFGSYNTGGPNLITLGPRNGSDNATVRIGTTSTATGGNADSRGIFHAIRASSASQQYYRNNSQIATDTDISSNVATLDFFGLGLNVNGGLNSPSLHQLSYAAFGEALDNTERGADQNAVETYMDSNGKGVIP